ncbi:uncharacterized protein LOC121733985 [Aricia agestis]|uniref:uncharacterized protein LOC121733985 n=1 Tax=Aricia agestis TaxID=91739 RepID=UPI001C205209|nr:uncharacterized protein LOC121733985 [Aricia agestis]
MKFICAVLLVAAVAAEPPRRQFQFQRQEAEPAPYPAAGYRPTKEFKLPSREELSPPSTNYGVPDNTYEAPFNSASRNQNGAPFNSAPQNQNVASFNNAPQNQNGAPFNNAPQNQYGAPFNSAPQNQYGTPRNTEDKEVETIEENNNAKLVENRDAEVVNTQGAYYVLLPGSQLQRVQFQTENDIRNMAYTARLQYKNEDRAPLFVYTAPQYQPTAAYVQLV